MNNQLLMISNTWMVWGIVAGLCTCLPIIFLVICYLHWAPKNIFFTFGHENWAMYVMGGGRFSGRVILPSKKNYVDENYDLQHYSSDPKIAKQQWEKYGLRRFATMYWIGLYPFRQVKYRHQVWQEWRTEQVTDEDGKEKSIQVLHTRDEHTPYLITKPFAYAMFLNAAENKDNLPIDLGFTLFIEPVNLYRPIFGSDDPYGQLQGIVLSAALLYVRVQTFAQLETEKSLLNLEDAQEEHDSFSKFIRTLNQQIPGQEAGDSVLSIYGYRILGAKVNSVVIAGKNSVAMVEATTKRYVAEQEKAVEILQSEGKAKAIQNVADAKKYELDNYYEKMKNLPYLQQIELAKAMFENSNLTTFVSGKDVTPTIPVS